MTLGLDPHQLAALGSIAEHGSLSGAARALHVTQPALSQRLRKLEEATGTLLVLRGRTGARLTPAGERVLRHARTVGALEAELADDLGGSGEALAGTVRVAGFSSVMRSCVLPALAPLLRAGAVGLTFAVAELRALPAALDEATADFVLLDRVLRRPEVEAVRLGRERHVLARPAQGAVPEGVYLDHDPDDETTFAFFRRNGSRKPALIRRYVDDVYGILDGVALGLGRAVVSEHLLDGRHRVVPGYKSLETPVVLHAFRRPAGATSGRLHRAVREALVAGVPPRLQGRGRSEGGAPTGRRE